MKVSGYCCGMIIVRVSSMVVDFVIYPCPRSYVLTNIYLSNEP